MRRRRVEQTAFLEAVRLTDGARDFSGLLILKFDDELPFGDDGRLSHAHGLYTIDAIKLQHIVQIKVLSAFF